MGGRDFTAWALVQGVAFGLAGIVCGVWGLAAGIPLLAVVGLVLLAIGIGTAYGR